MAVSLLDVAIGIVWVDSIAGLARSLMTERASSFSSLTFSRILRTLSRFAISPSSLKEFEAEPRIFSAAE